MAHLRKRHIESLIQKQLGATPCIGVVGMRQTGKTTLLRALSREYYTFDSDELVGRLSREGEGLISAPPYPKMFDEVQKYPPFFDLLKVAIDRERRPARYLLTGSIRFSSRKPIRESLTGRMILHELSPLTLSELHERPIGNFLRELLTQTSSASWLKQKKPWLTEKAFNDYLTKGGLPGICFVREATVRQTLWNQHLDTLLGRDLQWLTTTRQPQERLRDLLSVLGAAQGSTIKVARVAKEVRIAAPTTRKLLAALEGLFLIRFLGDAVFLEDQGLLEFLSSSRQIPSRPRVLGAVFHELRAQIQYSLRDPATLTEFRTRGGAEVPFVIRTKTGSIAISLDVEDRPSEKSLKSLAALSRTKHISRLIALHGGSEGYLSSRGVLCLPVTWIY